MKHLRIEADVIDGKPVTFLHCEPLVAELPPPMPLPVPEKADAGHIAAMALYLTLGEDAEVTVTEEAEELLESDLYGPAKKRGVYTTGTIIVSDDGSRMVELIFSERIPVV